LEEIEILYAPYGIDPSETSSDAIVNWLNADKTHILFMACETGAGLAESIVAPDTNIILRTKVGSYTNYSTPFAWNGLGNAVGGLIDGLPGGLGDALEGLLGDFNDIKGVFPAQNYGDVEFFGDSAAFGAISNYGSVAAFECTDGMAGFAFGTLPVQVKPLVYSYRSIGYKTVLAFPPVVANDPVRTVEVLMAADTDNRVVYIGESELFAGVDTSTAGDNLDKLLLNLWGWAAETASTE
jgi:hypothetical protein